MAERGLIHKEVFQDECALPRRERATATKASDLAISAGIFDPCVDEFVIGPTVATAERRWRVSVHSPNLNSANRLGNRASTHFEWERYITRNDHDTRKAIIFPDNRYLCYKVVKTEKLL
jgi:hypothetical protein